METTKCIKCGYESISTDKKICTKKSLLGEICMGKLEIIAQEEKE